MWVTHCNVFYPAGVQRSNVAGHRDIGNCSLYLIWNETLSPRTKRLYWLWWARGINESEKNNIDIGISFWHNRITTAIHFLCATCTSMQDYTGGRICHQSIVSQMILYLWNDAIAIYILYRFGFVVDGRCLYFVWHHIIHSEKMCVRCTSRVYRIIGWRPHHIISRWRHHRIANQCSDCIASVSISQISHNSHWLTGKQV